MAIPTAQKPIAPLALPAADVAKLLVISERHLWSLHSAGKIPRPLALGRCRRWSYEELQSWLAAGGPPRGQWEAMQGERSKGPRKSTDVNGGRNRGN